MLVSQPSLSLFMLQSAKPVEQAPVQPPPLHTVDAMFAVEQTLPQPPQFVGSTSTLVSQPSFCLLWLQSSNPVSQAPVQVPRVQVGDVMWLLEQSVPQAPQVMGSLVRLASQPSACLLPLQSANPWMQAPLHTP